MFLISLLGIAVKIIASVFIYLKVMHVVDWSWFWVVSPLWLFLCGVSATWAVSNFQYLFYKEPHDNE